MSGDLVATTSWQLLVDSSSKPVGLATDRILFEEIVPQDLTDADLPLVAVYLAEDNKVSDAGDGNSNRIAIVQVEIRARITAGQTPLSATKPFRDWVLATLLPDMTADTGMEGAEFEAFRPFGIPGKQRLAGALLELSAPFLFDPRNP